MATAPACGGGGGGGESTTTEFAVQGPHAVVREDTADFVYFFPEEVGGEATWPSVVWFNGLSGYTEDFNYDGFLESLASWGFVVVGGKDAGMNTGDADQLSELLRRDSDPVDVLFGRIDEARIAGAGHSLGGIQTVIQSADYRVAVAIQGANPEQPEGAPPILYMTSQGDEVVDASLLIGAFENARAPSWLANHASVDHNDPRTDGGVYREPIVAFLRWRLEGDANGAVWFEGDSCMLCADSDWTFESR